VFLLVPAHPGSPGQRAVKRLLLLLLCEISWEPLNGFAPNSHRRHIWSFARMSLKVKVKGQGHQGQKTAFFGPSGGLIVCLCLVKHL